MSFLGAIVDATRRADLDQPPIRFTTEADRGFGNPFLLGGTSLSRQLDLTTTESTLQSVISLISSTTAAVKWCAFRKQDTPDPHAKRQEITPDKSLPVKLWRKPNSFMTGKHLRKICTWHYAAVGEAWMVVEYYDDARTMPRSWWPVRPDRMTPVPDPDDYLDGYVYTGPSGERIPLDLNEVLRITNPHPKDPHRGIGPVQSLITPLATSMASQSWINAFFQNDASPGGIIQIPQGLEDSDYNRLRKRWNEQHRGVNRAHRVAILEFGSWVPTTIDMQKMQFTEIRKLTRDQILEAFRIHQHKMGASDDVNLANAAAADATFAKDITRPMIEEWADLANGPYIELFGTPGAAVEFDPEEVVPEDAAAEQAALAAKVGAAVALTGAGWDPDAVLEAVGLPPIPMAAVEPPPSSEPDPVDGGDDGSEATDGGGDLEDTGDLSPSEEDAAAKALLWGTISSKLYLATEGNTVLKSLESRDIMRSAGAPLDDGDLEEDSPPPAGPLPPVPPGVPPAPPVPGEPPAEDGDAAPSGGGDGAVAAPGAADDQSAPVAVRTARITAAALDVDLTQMAADWDAALDKVLAKWPGILDKQYTGLQKQVKAAIDAGDLQALLDLITPDGGAETALTSALVAVAVTGGKAVEREATEQGVKGVKQAAPEKDGLSTTAKIVSGLLRAALATSAAREAVRVTQPGMTGAEVAELVRAHLDALTDAQPREFLGGALTAAQNAGRAATFDAGPAAVFYGCENLDSATCAPCRKVDGRELGSLADAMKEYPSSGYVGCLGGNRCRGTFVAKWDIGGED